MPVDTAKRILPDLKSEGRVDRAYLGLTSLTIDASLERLDLPVSKGVLVQSVQNGSAAEKAGLRGGDISAEIGGSAVQLGGDIITKVDDRAITSADDLAAAIMSHKPGDEVTITYLREGKQKTTKAKLGKQPASAGARGSLGGVASGTRIKHCGITGLDDATAAVEAGAWALGMIFWPGSPRACGLEAAARVTRAFRRRVEIFGVFVNQTLDEVAGIADEVQLGGVQLHGDEGPQFCAEVARRTGAKVIRAARVRSGEDVQALRTYRAVDFHLVDAHVEGSGAARGRRSTGASWARWGTIGPTRSRVVPPLIVSGGLNPGNVAEAIAAVHPFGVDVASGTEAAPGVKDHAKLVAFGEAVRAADEAAAQAAEVPA